MRPQGPRLRRSFRAGLLRGRRLVARHHFSLLSGAIIAGALVVAMTSSSLGDKPRPALQPPPAGAVLLDSRPTVPLPPAPDRLLVYYLIDSPEQQRTILEAMANDAVYRGHFDVPANDTDVFFLPMRNPDDEAHAAKFIHQITESAAYDGYILKVIDMTRE